MEKHRLTAKAVFDQAHEIITPAERKAYLDEVCADDPNLREKVEGLLQAYVEAGSFDGPAPVFFPTADFSILERPGTRIGPYKLLEQIGEGGMGLVFVAEQQHPVRR